MRCCALAVVRVILAGSVLSAAPFTHLERSFQSTVKPFVATYCLGCHSGSSPAAMFDLKPYKSAAAVVRDYGHWTHVLDRVSAGQMLPKAAKQPSSETRKQVIAWIQAMRDSEAKKNAGDPGVVLARRLSNSEYNYTIRDLTGVDIQPTKEFPADPANTAGFDNSGESADYVAGAAEQVPSGRAAGRRSHGSHARRNRVRPASDAGGDGP